MFRGYAPAATGSSEPGRVSTLRALVLVERSNSHLPPPTENLIVEGTNIRASQAISVKAESRSLGEQFATELVSSMSRSTRSFRHPAKIYKSHYRAQNTRGKI